VSRRLGADARASDLAKGMLGAFDRSGIKADRARAVMAWRDAAGEEVASHARGFALRDGELLVFVDSGAWANELSALAEEYRSAVNERVGKEMVSSMRFTVSRNVADQRQWDMAGDLAKAERAKDRTQPVPASETEIAQIQAMAATVKSEKVREAAVAAAIRSLEWRKGLSARKAAQKAAERPTGPDRSTEH
jgi:hypothetical protein